jgi:cyclopropane-fatty-acyl-phospholipid synthase
MHSSSPLIAPARRVGLRESALRGLFSRCDVGQLTVKLPGSSEFTLEGSGGVRAEMQVRRWRAFMRLLMGGDIGLAQAYRAGDWTTPDLKQFLTWGIDNEVALDDAMAGNAASRVLRQLQHGMRQNTRNNSRRNISAHYDLGNDFYAHWLDVGMNYSSGLYTIDDCSLEWAQTAKLDRVCSLLDLAGGERVLEIGCGWGALAERLTASHACHVTGLTLSEAQREYAAARLQNAGLGERADIRLEDYRDVTGTFDRVASIEMLEAVGEAYWPQYFAKLRECLAPGGTAVLQVICIAPDRYAAYRQRPDFIQTHIFPGGALPTSDIVCEQAEQAGLTTTAVEMFAPSYARTLADWRRRFNAAWPSIIGLGFDERFRRLWNYYLVYCEVGFECGALDVGIFQLRPTS